MKKILTILLCAGFLLSAGMIFGDESDSRYGSDKNLPFNEKEKGYDPQTGSISVNAADIQLAGIKGLNFILSRTWTVQTSNVYNMTYTRNGDSLNCDTIERANRFGIGWNTAFPFIQKPGSNEFSENKVTMLFLGGQTFQLDSNGIEESDKGRTNIIGYDLEDKKVRRNTDISYDGAGIDINTINNDFGKYLKLPLDLYNYTNVNSKYELEFKTLEKYYFLNSGQLMMRQDATGTSKMWFFYQDINPVAGENNVELVLRVVKDSLGRYIVFDYDQNGNVSEVFWYVNSFNREVVKENGEETVTIEKKKDLRSVKYFYSEFKKPDDITIENKFKKSYILDAYVDPAGYRHEYKYEVKTGRFTFNKERGTTGKNYYLLLSEVVRFPHGDGDFVSKQVYSYDPPSDRENYVNLFRRGFIQHYRLTKSYMVNKEKRIFNETSYIYRQRGENGLTDMYETEIHSGGIIKTYRYNGSLSNKALKDTLESVTVKAKNITFEEIRSFKYDLSTRAKISELRSINNRTFPSLKFKYDSRGNVKKEESYYGLITEYEYGEEDISEPTVITQKYNIDNSGAVGPHGFKFVVTQSFYKDGNVYPLVLRKASELYDVDGNIKIVLNINEYDEWLNLTSTETGYADIPEGTSINSYLSRDAINSLVFGTDSDRDSVIKHFAYEPIYNAFPVKESSSATIDIWDDKATNTEWWLDLRDGQAISEIGIYKVFNDDGSVWLEIDNEGYAIEHYYNKLGQEIQTIMPDSDDIVLVLNPSDYNVESQVLANIDYLESRKNNPGVKIVIDYYDDKVTQFIDVDRSSGNVKAVAKESDGLGNVLKEIEYPDPKGLNDLTAYVKEMTYDSQGRLVAITDPDRSGTFSNVSVGSVANNNQAVIRKYDKTWIIRYDDLGRQIKIEYPGTPLSPRGSFKTIVYEDGIPEDSENPKIITKVTTVNEDYRVVSEYLDFNNKAVKVEALGYKGETVEPLTYYIFYDGLERKVEFRDAKGLVTKYKYNGLNNLIMQTFEDKANNNYSASEKIYYDYAGNPVSKVDRRGSKLLTEYDELKRNTRIRMFKNKNEEQRITNPKADAIYDETPEFDIRISYDKRGNVVRVDGQNLIEFYEYDHSNRVTKLSRKLKFSGEHLSELDSRLARVLYPEEYSKNISLKTGIQTFEYIYNDGGMITEMKYPDGAVHKFTNSMYLNRLEKISEILDGQTKTIIDDFEYNNTGVVTKMVSGNGVVQNWEFDNRKRICGINIDSTKFGRNYEYEVSGSGNILAINDNRYSYNGFNWLTGAKTYKQLGDTDVNKLSLVSKSYGTFINDTSGVITSENLLASFNSLADFNTDKRVNGRDYYDAARDYNKEKFDEETFEYDGNGNRTKLIQNGKEYRYTYGVRNQLVKIEEKIAVDTYRDFIIYSYDANGNTLSRTAYKYDENGVQSVKEKVTFEYDTLNRVIKTTKEDIGEPTWTQYYYDNANNRFIKTSSDKSATFYLRHGQIAVAMDVELYSEVVETSKKEYGHVRRYYLSGDLIAGRAEKKVTRDENVEGPGYIYDADIKYYYYHLDHLNSTKIVTDSEAKIYIEYEYRAFGEQLQRLAQDGEDNNLVQLSLNPEDDRAKYSYGGKEFDEENGLYYFNARYYDATIGRFINVDPAQDGTNWYIYCNNNPLSFVDPTGLTVLDPAKQNLSMIINTRTVVDENTIKAQIYCDIQFDPETGQPSIVPGSLGSNTHAIDKLKVTMNTKLVDGVWLFDFTITGRAVSKGQTTTYSSSNESEGSSKSSGHSGSVTSTTSGSIGPVDQELEFSYTHTRSKTNEQSKGSESGSSYSSDADVCFFIDVKVTIASVTHTLKNEHGGVLNVGTAVESDTQEIRDVAKAKVDKE